MWTTHCQPSTTLLGHDPVSIGQQRDQEAKLGIVNLGSLCQVCGFQSCAHNEFIRSFFLEDEAGWRLHQPKI